MEDLGMCEESVSDWTGFGVHQCSRKAVEVLGDRRLCKQHANSVRYQREKDRKWREEDAASDAAKQRANVLCDRLGGGRPYLATPHRGLPRYDGGVVLTEDEAKALIARLEDR